ncbi:MULTISPECIES: Type 1 glutamine amidotransferase-like domain-containing protein [unclassified Plantibacter]|uniref:Type 1 glutamine amidotransferase-like domain-containing protein n=1 Tax=unclassified Plantibacter TaxID=2624265 RepID=UPI003D34E167
MSVFLVGGPCLPETESTVYSAFLAEAAALAVVAGRQAPRIAIVVVHHEDGTEDAAGIRAAIERAGVIEAVPVVLGIGGTVEQSALAEVDGIVVGGGLPSAYAAALEPVAGDVRRLVATGLPYLGISAGAMIAADHAIVGGWRIGDVPVSPEGTAEGLDEVTLADGLGLVDLAVDAHAAQWGTVSRLVAATEAGMIDGGLAVDENTALVVGQGALRVLGGGSVWQVFTADHGVVVRTMGAEHDGADAGTDDDTDGGLA